MVIITINVYEEVVWMWRSRISAASTLEAELQALYVALLVVKFRNVREITIEGDNKNILDNLDLQKDCQNCSLTLWFDVVLFLAMRFHANSFGFPI